VAPSNPLRRGSRGGMFQNHGTGGGNGSIMVGMFVCLCLASQKHSKREFFVPVRMDLGVKLSSEGATRQMAAAQGMLITRGALKTCKSCAIMKAKQKNLNNESERVNKADKYNGQIMYHNIATVKESDEDKM